MPEPTKQRVPSIGDTIRDGIDTFDNLASTIANPRPDRPLEAAVSRSGQLMCDFYGALPSAARDVFGPSSPLVGLLCKPYYDANGYDGPVPGPPPYVGGQCTGKRYRVDYEARRNDEAFASFSETTLSSKEVWGPVTVFGALAWDAGSTLCATPFTRSYEIGFFTAGGAPDRGGLLIAGSTCPSSVTIEVRNLTFVLISAGPDCGDPESDPVPGTNPPPTPPAFPTGQGPGVDPDGQPYFFIPPIDPEYPGDEPTEVPVFGPDGQKPTGPPPGPGEPGTPVDTGVGDAAEDEADEGQMLWALKVDILGFPPIPNEYAPGVYRGVAYIYMGTASGLDHDPAGSMLRSGQLILAEKDYLTRWRVAANSGYNLRVTPYYKPIEG